MQIGTTSAKRVLIVLLLLFTFEVRPASSATPRKVPKTTTKICDIVRNPKRYDGTWVRVRAAVVHNPEFTALTDGCGIAFAFPDESQVSTSRVQFTLVKDAQFERFMSAVSETRKQPTDSEITLLSPDYLFDVSADFIGRIKLPDRSSKGFGHLNTFPALLVVRQVMNVNATPRE